MLLDVHIPVRFVYEFIGTSVPVIGQFVIKNQMSVNAVCRQQVMPGSDTIDMIDTSPGPDARVSLASLKSLLVCELLCVFIGVCVICASA